jgi:hypothetical protein
MSEVTDYRSHVTGGSRVERFPADRASTRGIECGPMPFSAATASELTESSRHERHKGRMTQMHNFNMLRCDVKIGLRGLFQVSSTEALGQ